MRWEEKDIFGAENNILFGDILRLESPTREYEQITDKKKLMKVLDDQ